jgi:hypothetical protein
MRGTGAKKVHGNAYRQVTRWFDAERRHPTPAGLGVKGGEARRSAALVGWPSYRQITVAAGGTTRKPP